MRRNQAGIIWVLMIVLVYYFSPLQARMYRWVDENGQVHFGDNVPTEYSQRERKVLDNGGRLISTIAGPKSQAQLEAQKQQDIAEEARLKERQEQLKTDRVLMSAFSSAQELDKFHNERMGILYSILTSLRNKLYKLRQMQSKIKSKTAMKAKESDLKKIERINAEVDSVQRQFDIQMEKTVRTEKRFMAEAERYEELKGK
jgi:hypothetical protein